jgi:hypothetical protein
MDEPKPYKSKIRHLKAVEDGARAGARQPREGGGVLRKRQLQSRLEAQNDTLIDELDRAKRAQAMTRSLLEGMVRHHGPTSLSFDFLESCTGHEVEWPQAGSFGLTLKLKAPKLEEVAPPEPVGDDPFVANLGPVAKMAYEVAVAKAQQEERDALRRK